jgi:tetrachlorobenzoquinone reductase
MSLPQTFQVRVRSVSWEAESVLGFELAPPEPNTLLPPFDAGAHIDLHLGNGQQRSYSLTNTPGERQRYCIAVNKDAASRGGSRWVHEALRPGALLTISAPRNNFALNESATHSVLIAGGIGITPILGMIRRLAALGRPWRLHYAARTRAHAAFVETLRELADASAGSVEFNFDQEPGGHVLDLAGIVAALPADAHLYCCGPLGLLAAFEKASSALPRERVHVEYFAAKDAPATDGGFSVRLQRSGKTVMVRPGQSILDSVIAIGIEPPWSCREGVCGTCETRVIEGVPDHRDLVLSAADHAANDRMMICCSGAKTATLVLDL